MWKRALYHGLDKVRFAVTPFRYFTFSVKPFLLRLRQVAISSVRQNGYDTTALINVYAPE